MTLKEFIREEMLLNGISYGQMASDLLISEQALWDRLNSKKTNNLTIDRLKDMLGAVGYEIVLRNKDSKQEHILGKDITMPESAADIVAEYNSVREMAKNGIISEEDAKTKLVALEKKLEAHGNKTTSVGTAQSSKKKVRVPYFENPEQERRYIQRVMLEYYDTPCVHLEYGKVAKARGKDTKKGFILFKGSVISPAETESCPQYVLDERTARQIYITPNYMLTTDLLFTSSSAAAGFVTGTSLSGKKWWVAEDGKPLGELPDTSSTLEPPEQDDDMPF